MIFKQVQWLSLSFFSLINKVALVGKMDGIRIIYKTDKMGWGVGYLGGIIKFNPSSSVKGRLCSFNGLFKYLVQRSGPDTCRVLVEYLFHKIEYFQNPLSG